MESRSNHLAHRLIQQGVGPETLVGLYVDRSPAMVVGLLAILKAGGAYVPLDPSYPESRLAYMIQDSGLQFLVLESHASSHIFDKELSLIAVEGDKDVYDADRMELPLVTLDNLAYVIYTSGSTGNPKGVQITHRNVLNFIQSMVSEPGFDSTDRLVSVTTLSFDISVLEILMPLLTGGVCVLASPLERTDGKRLRSLLSTSGAHVMQATPSTWRMLLDSGWEGDVRGKFLCGGETMPEDLAKRLCELGHEVWNMYGPTETTVWSAIQKVEPEIAPIPIGKPIGNTEIYVLDAEGYPVPKNVTGALFVGGIGLARGYLNRSKQTAEKFLPDPFHPEPGARMYSTGDLARWNSGGVLECVGRTDSQIKLRGFRIELGEIESVLRLHSQVREAAVVVLEDGGEKKRLIAFIQPTGDLSVDTVLEFCRSRLPNHMIPALIRFLDVMPLTDNGKIHRAALPLDIHGEIGDKQSYRAPVTKTEHILADIWADVLDLPRVGLDDNFFELGGDSILSLQVVYRAIERGVAITSKQLFTCQTVVELAAAATPLKASEVGQVS